MIADLGVAFTAGLASCASACVLPLLPAFVAYLGGLSSPSAAAGSPGRRRSVIVVGSAGLFVAGFGTVFVAFGAAAGMLGAQVAAYRPTVVFASGVMLMALGVALVAGLPFLMCERRFQVAHQLPRSPLAAYVVGLAFAAGWTPCVGPILAAILVLAANTTTAIRGAALLAAYSAGLGLPFLAAGAFVAPVTQLLARARGVYPALSTVAAVVLIAMGALTLTNRLTVLNGFFPNLAPAIQTVYLSATPPPAGTASRLSGQTVPAVTVVDVAGHRLGLREPRGRPVVVNFWATWCVPCKQELPLFAAAWHAHRAQGLTVVPIDYEESHDAVMRFWRDLGLDLTPYLDSDGAVARTFGVGLQETGLPVTILVDRHSTVRAVLPGQVDPQLFATRLDQILSQ